MPAHLQPVDQPEPHTDQARHTIMMRTGFNASRSVDHSLDSFEPRRSGSTLTGSPSKLKNLLFTRFPAARRRGSSESR